MAITGNMSISLVILTVFIALSYGFTFAGDKDCDHKCVLSGNTYCGPIPCPYFPCDVPLKHTSGDCCEHCPKDKTDQVRREDDPCPANCTQGGQRHCNYIPCYLPPCVDPVTTPGECCSHCPNGPNCSFRGVTIPVGQTFTVDMLRCHCRTGGLAADENLGKKHRDLRRVEIQKGDKEIPELMDAISGFDNPFSID